MNPDSALSSADAPPEKRHAFPGDAGALITCFLRSYLVAAGFNAHGMQNLGFIYAIEPGLRRIYSNPDRLRDARERYITHYNTHPFWTPLLLGIFLHEERNIRTGVVPARTLLSVKDTACYSLSAVGDSVFTGTLLPCWAIGTSCLVVAGWIDAAAAVCLLLFALLQAFRLYTFVLGLRNGMNALIHIRRLRLIDWGQRFKVANAALLAVFLRLAAPAHIPEHVFYGVTLLLCAAAWGVGRKRAPRVVMAAAVLILWNWRHILTG